MNDEVRRILKMVEEGKISAEEGANLMEVLEATPSPGTSQQPTSQQPESPPPAGTPGKIMRIQITDRDTGKTKVNIRLPLGILRFARGLKGLIPNSEIQKMEQKGIDLDEILGDKSTNVGTILDMTDEEEGEHILITIE